MTQDVTWTLAQQRAVNAYLQYLATALGLRDWTLSMDWEKSAGKHTYARVDVQPMSRHATVRVGPQFANLSPAMQTQTLCHELMHCHLDQLRKQTELVIAQLSTGRKLATTSVHQVEEYTVDALADVLTPFVRPLSMPGPGPGVTPLRARAAKKAPPAS